MDDFKFGDARDHAKTSAGDDVDDETAKRYTSNDAYPFDWSELPPADGLEAPVELTVGGATREVGAVGYRLFHVACTVDDCGKIVAIQASPEHVDKMGRRHIWGYVWRAAYDEGWARSNSGDWYCDEHLRERSC